MSSRILILATGGTIACTSNAAGALEPTLSVNELLDKLPPPQRELDISGRDLARLDSSSLSLANVDLIVEAVHSVGEGVDGVVVTHGTDSLEETALALDLVHDLPFPVVLTGSQFPADSELYDGIRNLHDAIDAAATLNPGVHVVFGGRTLPARGLFKAHSHELAAFDYTPTPRPDPVARHQLAGIEVPLVSAWPGASATVLEAAVRSKADGVVVVGMGAGNVGTQMADAMEWAASMMPVVMATRVPYGEVRLVYGRAGGGATLAEAGVMSAGSLSPGQARIALVTALAAGVDPTVLL